jgi:hypothetical protein
MEGPLTPPAALTVLFTAGLRGDLDLLPRLYTVLRDLQARAEGGTVLRVDLGDRCAPDVWHCATTGGRSMLVALDGMGFHAANVAGTLPPELRRKMGDATQMALVDAEHPFTFADSVRVTAGGPAEAAGWPLVVDLDAVPACGVDGRVLRLGGVRGGQVGRAQLRGQALEGWDAFEVPPDAAPDPTIAAVVDFILSEARYARSRSTK